MYLNRKLEEIDIKTIETELKSIKKASKLKIKRRGSKMKAMYYWDLPCAFDIEATSTRINGEKTAWMYEWTLGIDRDTIYIGRTWDEFITLYNLLCEVFETDNLHRLIIYVHNLAFDFSYFSKRLNWENVFSVDSRKPLKATTVEGIEFRCSALLSASPLEEVAKHLTSHDTRKLIGDLDYSIIRTSETPLTEKEYGYCINDVQILLDYIDEQIALYGDIAHVPNTNTGRVRNYCRDKCLHVKDNLGKTKTNLKYHYMMRNMSLTPDEYTSLNNAFAGGFTHSNPLNSMLALKNVQSWDLTSDYPNCMMMNEYPTGKGRKVNVKDSKHLDFLLKNYAVVFTVRFKDLEAIVDYDYYLSKSKCLYIEQEDTGADTSNGRVIRAKDLIITITGVDFRTIKKVYKWSAMAIKDVWVYNKGYLPKEFILAILDLYKDKTELKGVKGKEAEYMVKKGMLNSAFGMCAQDIFREPDLYEDYEWCIGKVNKKDVIAKYNVAQNRFISYSWAPFITALARERLWDAILELKDDYCYADTDSVKILNGEKHRAYFEKNNNENREKLFYMCRYYGIDPKMTHPKTIEGDEKHLGDWDYEGEYHDFKTISAKRYAYSKIDEDGFGWHLTNAGVSKGGIKTLLRLNPEHPLDAYKYGIEFLPEECGKLCHTYIEYSQEGEVIDYLGNKGYYHELSSCHLEPIGYKMQEDDDFLDIVLEVQAHRKEL